jgi:hypothetical protein
VRVDQSRQLGTKRLACHAHQVKPTIDLRREH